MPLTISMSAVQLLKKQIFDVHSPEREIYILAFYPEISQKINCGRNPNEVIQFKPDGKKYLPGNSLNQRQQILKQTSIPCKPEEIEVAENFVVEYTLNKIYN